MPRRARSRTPCAFRRIRACVYGIEVRPTGAVTATFGGDAILVALPKARLDLWLRPDEVSVEGSQPIGGGKVLQIVLEKDDAGAPRTARTTERQGTRSASRRTDRRYTAPLDVIFVATRGRCVSRRVERCYNIAELRKLAKSNMPAPMFHYIDGAADDEWTLRRNTAAFDDVRVLAAHARRRVRRSTCRRRCSVSGSTGRTSARRPRCSACSTTRARARTARAAHASGTIFSLSSVSSTNIEDAAKLSPGPKVFQVYMFKDRGLSREFVQRAQGLAATSRCSSRSTSRFPAIASATS